jgi:hypothetical protein
LCGGRGRPSLTQLDGEGVELPQQARHRLLRRPIDEPSRQRAGQVVLGAQHEVALVVAGSFDEQRLRIYPSFDAHVRVDTMETAERRSEAGAAIFLDKNRRGIGKSQSKWAAACKWCGDNYEECAGSGPTPNQHHHQLTCQYLPHPARTSPGCTATYLRTQTALAISWRASSLVRPARGCGPLGRRRLLYWVAVGADP